MIENLNNISNTIIQELPHLKNFQWLPSPTLSIIATKNITDTFNPTPTFIFTSNAAGKINCNYGFSTTTEAVIGENKITFNSLRQREAAYNDITIKLVDENDTVISNILTVPAFKVLKHEIEIGGKTLPIGGEFIGGELNTTIILWDLINDKSNLIKRNENFKHGNTIQTVENDNDTIYKYNSIKWYNINGDITNPSNYKKFTPQLNTQWYTHQINENNIGKRIACEYEWTDNTGETQSALTFPSVIISDNTELQLNISGQAYQISTRTDTNPTLVFRKGFTYKITLNNTGHPFAIYKDENRTEKYNNGLKWTNGSTEQTGENAQEKTNGVLYFTIPIDAPGKLYYKCKFHSNMKGEINIVETKFKIYYSNEKFIDTVNASSIIFNSLFKQYKMDYNILVDYFNMGDDDTLAYADFATHSFSINSYYFEQITQGSVSEGDLLGHINDICVPGETSTFVHEVIHILEGIGLRNTQSITNNNNTEYIGTAGFDGYKTLLKKNKEKINLIITNNLVSLPALTNDYITNNIVMIPMEDSGGGGSRGAHWDEGKWCCDGNGNDRDTPGRVKNGIYYPLLINEIMSSAGDYGPNKLQLGCTAKPDSRSGARTLAYITPMTIGALTDKGHIMNTESSWIVTAGERMEWELPNDLNDN